MHRSRLAFHGLLLLAVSCSRGHGFWSMGSGHCGDPVHSSRTEGTRPPLLLLPPSAADLAAREVPLLRGFGPPGEAVRLPLPSFDPCVLRIGGRQWSLEPVFEGGRARLPLGPAGEAFGDAVLAFDEGEIPGLRESGKLIFHLPPAGKNGKAEASPAVTARFGLEFELVPLLDPLPLGAGAELPLSLRFRGPGLPGARVRASVLLPGSRKGFGVVFEGWTDASGMILLPLASDGVWILRAEHRVLEEGRPLRFRTFLVFRTGMPAVRSRGGGGAFSGRRG